MHLGMVFFVFILVRIPEHFECRFLSLLSHGVSFSHVSLMYLSFSLPQFFFFSLSLCLSSFSLSTLVGIFSLALSSSSLVFCSFVSNLLSNLCIVCLLSVVLFHFIIYVCLISYRVYRF